MDVNSKDLILIVTSFTAAAFAFWKFTYEKRWEIKVTNYKKIMEALYDLKKSNEYFLVKIHASLYYEQIEYIPEVDEMKENEDNQIHARKYHEAKISIEKIADIEAIFLGNTVSILKKLLDRLDEISKAADSCNEEELYEEESQEIDNCINSMRDWAQENLFHWWERSRILKGISNKFFRN